MKFTLHILLIALPFIAFTQDKNECNKYHTGTFYNYPKNSNKQFISIRTENNFKEVEIGKTDTTVWAVKWDECTYNMKLLKGGKMTPDDKQLLAEHSLVYKVTGSGKDYYTFDGFIDKPNYLYIARDTM